jgi:NADH:ubiquinone oxidoreductase subunit 4 (subunit M)
MVTLGLFSGSLAGLDGAVYLMLTHGVISSGLFICVGILYDRYHTRVIRYYGGLTNFMPIFAICFLILILANISFPSTGSFIGEFIILSDVFSKNTVVAFLAGFGIILGAFYSVWLYNRVMFGAVDPYSIRYYSDLNSREFFILLVILFFTFFMGIFPTFFFVIMEPSLMLLNETFICKF